MEQIKKEKKKKNRSIKKRRFTQFEKKYCSKEIEKEKLFVSSKFSGFLKS